MSETKIPKIIHYCWLSNDPIPEQMQKYMSTWKKHLPDYEFKLWNFDVFDKNSSLWVQQAFDAKKYAFAADYIRFYAVYNYGGIYMDMDVEVLKPFDDLLNNDLMFAYEDDESKYLEAGCFGATKGNIFIKRCLEYYTERRFIKESGAFDTVPLPHIITPIYNSIIKVPAFLSDYFTAKSWETGELYVSENTYTIHHFAASWIDVGRILIRKEILDTWGCILNPEEELIYYNILRNKNLAKNKHELYGATTVAEKIFSVGKHHCQNENLYKTIQNIIFSISEYGIQNNVTSLKLYFTTFRKWKIFKTPRANLRYIYHCLRNLLHV